MGDSNRRSVTAAIPELCADANISVDVDGLDCYRAIHGLDDTDSHKPDPAWTVGVERARQLFSEFGIRATLFVVGSDLDVSAHQSRARSLVEAGHELANHTFEHPYDLREQPGSEIAYQINAADAAIYEATGERPVGFRAPGYNVDADVIAFSRRAGHRYDASVFPCPSYWAVKSAVMGWRKISGQRSRSANTDPKNLRAPRQPYFPDFLDCWRPKEKPGGYVEIPMAVFAARMVPIIGTSLHLLDAIGFERLWPLIDAQFDRFLSLEMHAVDFLDASDLDGVSDGDRLVERQPDLRIPWDDKKERYRRVFELVARNRHVDTLAAATEEI